MKTIRNLQEEYARALKELVPPGYAVNVALLSESGRKVRKDAGAHNWNPASGSISVTFQEIDSYSPENAQKDREHPAGDNLDSSALPMHLVEAVKALDAAERVGAFVSLKWFRDQYLPGLGTSWAAAPAVGQPIIKEAIDRGLFLTGKVPNPKAPAYPVTSIRLDRQNSAVRAALGTSPRKAHRTFRPVRLKGEPLSSTVIRDRR